MDIALRGQKLDLWQVKKSLSYRPVVCGLLKGYVYKQLYSIPVALKCHGRGGQLWGKNV